MRIPASPTGGILQLFYFSPSDGCLMVLISFSLMVNEAEHMSLCLLDIRILAFVKSLLKAFAYFNLGRLSFFLLICRNSLYILDTNSLLDVCIINTLSHSVDCIFTLLLMSFHE